MSTEKTLERPAGVGDPDNRGVWPDWVYKHVDRRNPFHVAAVGTAVNANNRRVVLILTSKNKDIQHFEIDRELVGAIAEMLQDALDRP